MIARGGPMAHGLFPYEPSDGNTPDLDDATYWLGVYVELVKGTQELGIRHDRFEERLAFWEEVVGRHEPPPQLRILDPGDDAR